MGWGGDHADLWNMLTVELTCRSCEVDMFWVKGHATRRDVQMGRSTSEDKVGNDGADLMAGGSFTLCPIRGADVCKKAA